MFYDKKVKYLEYRDNGERIGAAGFIKLEMRNEQCRFCINIHGLSHFHLSKEQLQTFILLSNDEKEVEFAQIDLNTTNGDEKICFEFNNLFAQDLNHTGMAYGTVKELRIPLAAGKEIYCALSDVTVQKKPEKEQKAVQNLYDSNAHAAEKTTEKLTPQVEEQLAEPPKEKPYVLHPIQENKWYQLAAIYPHVRPFQDDREYLSLRPDDFVILSEKNYGLAHNSFLLHGYYNYKHLILQRVEQRGEPIYYIGVPGNFYEQEKQVAVMFGFESFECLEEPARDGDYGYYMMRVEL